MARRRLNKNQNPKWNYFTWSYFGMKKDSNYNRGRSYCMQKTTDYLKKVHFKNIVDIKWSLVIFRHTYEISYRCSTWISITIIRKTCLDWLPIMASSFLKSRKIIYVTVKRSTKLLLASQYFKNIDRSD